MRVLTVIGTRPEAIKLAPVLHELERDADTFSSIVVTTGQHREMLDPMLELFEIQPDYDLRLMRHGHSLGEITRGVIAGLEPILGDERPDWVLVQGDTTTSMAASLAAFYDKTRVAHVEAGLRTFDKFAPYPEEINRRISGVLADVHFAPTAWARTNLLREAVPPQHVHLTGNTVIDALEHVRELGFDLAGSPLEQLPDDKRLVLITAHRNENLGPRMKDIATGLRELALTHDDVHFVYPMHLNPRARQWALVHLAGIENISLLEPLAYAETVWLLERAHLVVTDSGGLQEEAAGVGTPVLVLRETTERPEGIEAGIARLVEPEHTAIVAAVGQMLDDDDEYERMKSATCPYGDGRAAVRITDVLAGRPARLHAVDHIYERPLPAHPLDVLLREGTAASRRRADEVLTRARATSSRFVAKMLS
ncbi:MAG TPA: UDP-N-acetylglucosamine 2-epimerase (non-hydrolyzing) [Solirubrobacteraceae bacterium]